MPEEASMGFVESVLKESRVRYREYRCNSPRPIWLTAGNQLVASYAALSRFALVDPHYPGWRAHQVLDVHELERLGGAAKLPSSDEQVAVLLPQHAHIQRAKTVCNHASKQAPRTAADMLSAYAASCAFIGNYSGGGEQRIREELMAIARAILRCAGLL
jgi:hypothetical protein